ncbi:MAG: DinB family protein [Burkholderiales bacterium]|nr:DinB family protein [Burkholderiales bacterium]
MLKDPGGRERLVALGVRNVPVVARGASFVFGQNLEDVAEFVGLAGTGHTPLPPAELMRRWVLVLRALQRYARQLPDARIDERVTADRDRSIRLLAHHAFRIAEAFLESATGGTEYAVQHANVPPAQGTCLTGSAIAGYGAEVTGRLQQWWDAVADKSLAAPMKTYYGTQPMHALFERSTWHCAQHARQLMHVLERFGVAPDGPLTAAELAGLPLPERLFE